MKGTVATALENEETRVLKELTLPWAKTNRLVVGDSFFASVQAARALYHRGLFFIGVVKTATRDFPMKFLADKEFTRRIVCDKMMLAWKKNLEHMTGQKGSTHLSSLL